MNYLWETFKISFYLVIIIAFILIIYYFIKNRFNFKQSKEMEIIDTMRLASGEMLYLVKIFDEVLLLGGTKERVNHLKSWEEEDIVLDLSQTDQNNFEGKASDFKNMLLDKLKNRDIYKRNKQDQESDSDAE
ncbi:MAG: flagellar biosynthetic protein FliO [Halanaerobiales bacterium]|nr:flagellar biosynthetic protein FliO [Halanaerobiales bacterium]